MFLKSAAVSAPDDKGIVENSAVHSHSSIKLRINNSGCADYHFVMYIVIFAAFGNLCCQAEIITLELPQIIAVRHVT